MIIFFVNWYIHKLTHKYKFLELIIELIFFNKVEGNFFLETRVVHQSSCINSP